MNNPTNGIIFDIQKCSTIDGPGLRTTVFFKGCNLQCQWCHNPESQKTGYEMLFYKNKCSGCGTCQRICPEALKECVFCGKCTVYCPTHAREVVGKAYTVDEIFEQIATDMLFYRVSQGGVTFSGGECMLQTEFLSQLLKRCKEAGIHCAVDTAGCVSWDRFEAILPYTDLFLYDLKCFTDTLHKEGTGVSNRLILDNLCRLSRDTDKDIIIRIPIIPGFNDDMDELHQMADFLRPLRLKAVELLPYHTMGESKYEALGRQAKHFTVPDESKMERFRALFSR